jgi:hypothetical protein
MNRQRISEVKMMSMSRRGFFERLYEVHAGGDLCATLSFDSVFGGGATGLFGGDSWTFKRTGFFATRVTVRGATSEFDDAVFENRRWSHGGALTFPDGRKYSASAGKWAKGLQFLTETGEAVISFHSRGSFNTAVDIEVMRPSPDLPLLLLLGCYLVAVMLEESASSAAATVAAMG